MVELCGLCIANRDGTPSRGTRPRDRVEEACPLLSMLLHRCCHELLFQHRPASSTGPRTLVAHKLSALCASVVLCVFARRAARHRQRRQPWVCWRVFDRPRRLRCPDPREGNPASFCLAFLGQGLSLPRRPNQDCADSSVCGVSCVLVVVEWCWSEWVCVCGTFLS